MEVVKIFDAKFCDIVKGSIRSVLVDVFEPTESNSAETKTDSWIPDKDTVHCLYCRVKFDDYLQQRQHFKLDWHRYNLKLSLLSKPPITEDQFSEKNDKDDVSSISGSDSEKEDTYATAQGRIFLQNNAGGVFSIFACLLCNKKEELTDELAANRINNCISNRRWTVLMLGGGHFAGAVFDGNTPVVHKTFHCYTVRAGQGGSQAARDGKNAGSQPKSAGASLRRYNEQSLVQHVRDILEAWKGEMARSSLIVYRASGPYNRSVLFGGNPPLLDRADPRLRTFPFSTRRATFAEVKRAHSLLTLAHVYNSLQEALDTFTKQKLPESKRNKTRGPRINRTKSREVVDRNLPAVPSSSESSEGEVDVSAEMATVNFDDSLQPFGDSLTPEERKAPQRKRKPKKSKAKKLQEQEEKRKREVVEILSRGDLDKLENYLKVQEGIDEILDDFGNTLLHVAALNEQNDTVKFLLKEGANPCLKNQKQQTAYTCTQSREIREVLKDFARENPEKFNYNKAQIPTNTLDPEELAEKRKAQRKVKKEKEKVKKQENEIKKKEEFEKERFLKLSDREKRALAAERRILSQSGVVIARCFLCGSDMSGKVPFEYLGNRFCTVDCLKAHRMNSPLVLS